MSKVTNTEFKTICLTIYKNSTKQSQRWGGCVLSKNRFGTEEGVMDESVTLGNQYLKMRELGTKSLRSFLNETFSMANIHP